MRVVLAIAANTFREITRQWVFALILILAAAVLTILVPMPLFTLSHETDMFKDLALSTATLAMVFLVALAASSTMAEELDSRTAMTVLAKPVGRWQFLVGKYLGAVAALALAAAILSAVLFLATYLRVYFDATATERRVAFTKSQDEQALEFRSRMMRHAVSTLPGSVMMFYQAAALAAAAVVLASRFSRVLAVVVTFGLFIAGHLAEFITDAVSHSPDAARHSVTWAAALLPLLETFNVTRVLAHSTLTPGSPEWVAVWSYTGLAGLYALAYATFVLLVGVVLLRHKEMT